MSVWIAVLFVLYAAADITVLQAYCGNEALGIPPASKILAKQQQQEEAARRDKQFAASNDAGLNGQHAPGEEPESESDDECFCCCPHIATAFSAYLRPLKIGAFYRAGFSFFPKFLHSESHLESFYRPPRLD